MSAQFGQRFSMLRQRELVACEIVGGGARLESGRGDIPDHGPDLGVPGGWDKIGGSCVFMRRTIAC